MTLLCLGLLIPLYARDIEIYVEDTDLGIPLEGALIRSWDGTEYICDEEGKAVVPVPEDRQVVLQAAYPGYETGRLVVSANARQFSLGLRLSGIMENQELVIEAQKPGTSETKIGRSVAISDRDLAKTAEIGIVEDVMTSIKLLPGVGYTGMFNALPSIRGGEPGDLTAVFDGFYISNPYHWGGMASIFDPRMVKSAQLSHGIFSSRYGHTISGLLEVTARKPSPTEVEAELGISSSAANLNLSYPLWGKGGVMVMGKITYWDPFISYAKLFVEEVQYIRVAPYIRSGAVSAQYRFTSDLEVAAHGFLGGDGVGATYNNEAEAEGLKTKTNMSFDWDNKLGFFIAGLTYNPLPPMVLKATLGAGFHQADLKGRIDHNNKVPFSNAFIDRYGIPSDPSALYRYSWLDYGAVYSVDQTMHIQMTDRTSNYQGRADLDWDLGRGFLLALGFQELYSQWVLKESMQGVTEREVPSSYYGVHPDFPRVPYIHIPFNQTIDVKNQGFTTSAYTLVEYTTPQKRFGAELGLRMDHIYFIGKDFTIQTVPAFNPRLNLDFRVLQDRGILDALTLTVGTGLFSSMTDNIATLQSSNGIEDYEMKQNRSSTTIVGTKIDLTGGYSFTLEGYFKYVFDRAYVINTLNTFSQIRSTDYLFDGEGRIWGFDLMLQKLESRFWDGWISYSFNYARYRNPQATRTTERGEETGAWYYPSFHRFHNLNLILNIKPMPRFHITLRFGFASGAVRSIAGNIDFYPVLVLDDTGNPVLDENNNPKIIQKYKRSSYYSDSERDGFALPIDLKFSFYRFNPTGKGQMEVYFALENVLGFLKTRQGNTTFNSYTGKEDQGSDTASYQIPIPMPSIGFKWSY